MKTFFLQRIRNSHITILMVLAVIFFFVYSYFAISSLNESPKFTSPDETINYFFTKHFAENSDLRYPEALNSKVGNIIYPRNSYVRGDYIVPGSFLGMPLYYGLMAKLFGNWIILFLTPLLSVISVIFFYKLLKNIFSGKIALYSSLLLFIHPVFWYYSEKGMWHNVPFISFLIIGLYFLTTLKSKKPINYLMAGLFLALALAFRTSEIVWVGLLILLSIIFYWPSLNKKYLILALFSIIIIFAPILYQQKIIFGSSLAVGYSQEAVGNGDALGTLQGFWQKFKSVFLPFGFLPERFTFNFFNYSIFFLFFTFSSAIFGFLLLIKRLFQKKLNQIQIFYLFSFIIISIWLILFYGSYSFSEFLDPKAIVLGSSYLRYWLPIYVFGLPFLVVFYLWLRKKFMKIPRFSLVIIIGILIYSSFYTVMLDPLYGLRKTKLEDLAGYQKTLALIIKATESESVIISGPDEKAIFPERRVIAYNFNKLPKGVIENIPKLWESKTPVYYINSIPQELAIMKNSLIEKKLFFVFVKSIDQARDLYRLTNISD